MAVTGQAQGAEAGERCIDRFPAECSETPNGSLVYLVQRAVPNALGREWDPMLEREPRESLTVPSASNHPDLKLDILGRSRAAGLML